MTFSSIMAEDEDGVSNKKSPQNAENDESAQDSEQNVTKPDLGIEEAKYNIKENGDTSPVEAKISCSSECFTKLFFAPNIKTFLGDRDFVLQSRRVRPVRTETLSHSGTS